MSVSQANPEQLRPPGGDNRGSIVQVGAARRSEAIERLVSSGPAIAPTGLSSELRRETRRSTVGTGNGPEAF